MTQALTSQQQNIILRKLEAGKPITGTVTISIGVDLQADMVLMLDNNLDRFSDNLSSLFREAILCYKANGVDWRSTKSDDSKIDKLIGLVENLRGGIVKPDVVEKENMRIDASDGFSVE